MKTIIPNRYRNKYNNINIICSYSYNLFILQLSAVGIKKELKTNRVI